MSNNPYNNNFVSGGYFYNPIQRDITMVKGDTLSFAFQVQGLKGQLPDMIYLSVKAAIEDINLLFNISSDDFIKFREYDEDNDLLTYVVRIPPYLTADIDLGRYFYDLEMQVNQDNITLMKGRFTLDYQITGDNPEPPIYENGDNVRYPTTTEVGVVKLYTESYISEIGQAIIDINGLSQRYTTQEMSGALEDIKDEIDAIRAALNSSIGTPINIPLEDIPSAVSSDKIISADNFILNNLQSLRRTLTSPISDPCGVVLYPDEGKFSLAVSKDEVRGRLSFNIDPTTGKIHVYGVEFLNSNILGTGSFTWFDSSKPLTLSGFDMFYPELNADYYMYNNTHGIGCKESTNTGDIYDKPMQVYGIDSDNSYPLFTQFFANLAKHSLAELGALDIDFWDVILKNNWGIDPSWIPSITLGGIFICDDGNCYMFVTETNESFVYQNDKTIKLAGGGKRLIYNLVNYGSSNNFLVEPYQPYFGGEWGYNRVTTVITNPATQTIYTTKDIYDENNNLVKAANISLDEFKTFF